MQCVVPSNDDAICELDPNDPNSIDLDSFIEMANNATCTEIRNLLYMIDCSLIYWTWEGNCSDYGCGDFLFGRSTDDIYCSQTDSIAGPHISCENVAYQMMFNVIVANCDDKYPGLVWDSNVQQILF